jgi:6-pyruvoyl-tetrahydropterin synthase
VRGIDLDGNRFMQDTCTLDVSQRGARLDEIRCLKGPGVTIEVEYRRQKARFLVVWVGEGIEAGQIGIRCLEPTSCLWDVALPPPGPDDYEHASPEAPETPTVAPTPVVPSWEGNERRQQRRHDIRGRIDFRAEGTEVWLAGTLTDISLEGCYVETMTPLLPPEKLELAVSVTDPVLRAKGDVRTSHPNSGMGIAFTEIEAEDRERLQQLIQRLANDQAAQAEPQPQSTAEGRAEHVVDAIASTSPLVQTESQHQELRTPSAAEQEKAAKGAEPHDQRGTEGGVMEGEPALPPWRSPRKHPRVSLVTEVESRATGVKHVGRSGNISVGGVLILGRDTFDPNTEVVVRFRLPTGYPIETGGVVAHRKTGAQMGIKFLRLDEHNRQAIREFVQEVKPYSRRGHRVARRLRLMLRWRDLQGNSHEEQAETLSLSRYGGLLVTKVRLKAGENVFLWWPERQRGAHARIVFRRLGAQGNLAELGFEFLNVENFWGIDFPTDTALREPSLD